MKASIVLLILMLGLLSNLAAGYPHDRETLQNEAYQYSTLTLEPSHDGDDDPHLLTISGTSTQPLHETCNLFLSNLFSSLTATLYQARAPPQHR